MSNRNKKSQRNQKPRPGAKSRHSRSLRERQQTIAQAIGVAVQCHNAGNLTKAESIYRQVLELDPNQPDALHLLGVIAHQVGNNERAVELITQAIAARPKFAEAHSNLGVSLKALGRLDEAAASYRQALAIKHDYSEAHNNLGTTLSALGQHAEAEGCFRAAVAIKPAYAVAHCNLGNALYELGRYEEAVVSYGQSLAIRSDYAEAHCNLGISLHKLGRPDDAIASFARALAINPGYADAHSNLGTTLQEVGRLEEAESSCRQALAINPDHAEALGTLGGTLRKLGQHEQAIASYRQALAIKPNWAETHCNLGNTLYEVSRQEEAAASYQQALAINPDCADAHAGLANLYERANLLEQADDHVRQALDLSPGLHSAVICSAVLSRRRGATSEAVEILERLPFDELSPDQASKAYFELGKLYDLAHDSARALEYFAQGNRAQPKRRAGQEEADNYLRMVAEITQLVTPELVASWPSGSDTSGSDSVVFLVGFPRSGTTLLDQILDGHPRLQVMEEMPALAYLASTLRTLRGGYPSALESLQEPDVRILREQYFAAVERLFAREPNTILIDKFPLNLIHLPLAARLFPGVRVLLALRHPCDVVLSNFMQNYSLNAAMANFHSIADAANLYVHVMGLWQRCAQVLPLRIETVKYEDVVADLEGQSHRLLQFVDVDWNEAVLNYQAHAQQRERISTPSYEQVTQPIYQRSKYRWKRYEEQLQPVLKQLEPFVQAFGYS